VFDWRAMLRDWTTRLVPFVIAWAAWTELRVHDLEQENRRLTAENARLDDDVSKTTDAVQAAKTQLAGVGARLDTALTLLRN
jgi:outer membrane murein-binding lipoprotein Lpp